MKTVTYSHSWTAMPLFRAVFLNSNSARKTFLYPFSTQILFAIPTKIPKFFRAISRYYTETITPSYKSLLSHRLKNKRLDQARLIFDEISSPDVHLYTMMIVGYAKNYRLSDALVLFDRMPVRDTACWNAILKGCLDCGDLDKSRKLFDDIPEKNVISWTTMVNGYLKFGRVDVAERLFWEMPEKDVAAWNAMINGYCTNGRVMEGLRLFEEMPVRNEISWTSMIGGLDQNGKSEEALCLFGKMMGLGVEPNSSTFACALTACSNATDFRMGVQVHGCALKLGYCSSEFISASLVTFYSNCKLVDNANKIFIEAEPKNVVIWTALVTGYGTNGEHEDALRVFADMIKVGVFPNQFTFASALNSCCGLEALDKGKAIHSVAIKLGLETDAFVGNSFIVMYTECGNVNNGIAVFRKIEEKNVVSWNTIIVGCAQHGYGKWALIFFNQMVCSGTNPDEITFTGLLTACSHSGMLQKGRCFFEHIRRSKNISMKQQHYACMVDILGRCGRLEEAEELIRNMPMDANTMVWLGLLSACRLHSNVEVAERAAESIFYLDPSCSAAYVLLSNLYASSGRWSDVSRMRVKIKQQGVVKQPGSSWVVLRGTRHEFRSGDKSHSLSREIHEKLDWLGGKLKDFGYIPDQKFALHDVEDEQKAEMLSYHSERLAIAFALISTVEGSPITVMKNLRVCGDCHSAIKLMSKIVRREIVVRDSSRFHHFKNSICSCGDYW